MLNRSAEYALRAVIHIAEHESEGPQRAADVAEALGIPGNYLSKILHQLAAEGLLSSARGPAGGFLLGHPAGELTLAEIVLPFDPIEERCLLMRRPCSAKTPCVAHDQWKGVADRLRKFFRETTVSELLDQRDRRTRRSRRASGLRRSLRL